MATVLPSGPPKVPLIHNRRFRSITYQIVLSAVVLFFVYEAARNAIENLARANIATGFGFWNVTAGFDISQTLIEYSAQTSTNGRAFLVGLLNTLLVAGLGIVFATVLGFVIGICRLSRNWLLARIAGAYVEVIRNVPLLLQLYFWYNAVLKALPETRDNVTFRGGIFLNNRGLFLPKPVFELGSGLVFESIAVAIVLIIALNAYAARRQRQTGKRPRVLAASIALLIGLPVAVFFATGTPIEIEYPQLGRFNISGGVEVLPEFVALTFGLVIYTAAFIGEVVRSGIAAVAKGQTEAAYALGLRPGLTLRLVVVPQAMRVIVPPLTNQYLNLTKNSSLAVAIGYPDLVSVFAGTTLSQTGQAIEIISITMGVYLLISLVTSAIMSFYGWRLDRSIQQ
jgi:general L-amino acid transport system permease protein